MPVLEIEIVVDPGETLGPRLAQELADAAGQAMGTPRGRTWVKLRALPRALYAENGGLLPEDMRPVFVSLLKSKIGTEDEMREEASRLADGIGRCCGRPPENVHILYLPAAAGRMAFGGTLLPA
jgi:phenylpyruvate tautomerase PptA (4-oxalocrotonate tautomerase family)